MSNPIPTKPSKPYVSARRVSVPVEEHANGDRTVKFGGVGDLSLSPNESVMVYHSPGLPFLTIYTFQDLKEIVGWMQADQKYLQDKHRIMFEKDMADIKESIEDVDVDKPENP